MAKKITIGPISDPILEFDGSKTRSINFVSSIDVVGSELAADKMTVVVDREYTADSGEVLAGLDFDGIETSDGYLIATNRAYVDIRHLPYGTPIFYSENGEIIIKDYIKASQRIGMNTYKIESMSAIGLLDTPIHRGGMYSGITIPALLAEIIGGQIPYTVDPALANTRVFGWLPYQSKRANLHVLMFAYGVTIGRNADGDMHFHFISGDTTIQVPAGRIYSPNTIDYPKAASAAQIYEHSFIALDSDDVVTEYDNTDGSEIANNTLIVFRNAPLHGLETTGALTIVDSGVNWAIISGVGTLRGKKYTHSVRAMTKADQATQNDKENVAIVPEKCTLITPTNSINVLDRVLSYYSSKKTVKAAIVLGEEKAGDLVSFTDEYQERTSGYISSMSAVVSGITKATCEIVSGYKPTGQGANFSRSVLFTGSGHIDFEALVADKDDDLVQVFLIGGGHGGYRGHTGGFGTPGNFDKYGTPGEGGEGGDPGEGGKVLSVTIRVSELAQKVLAYSCGVGGESDMDGTETTLGHWTSNSGMVLPYGLVDIFAGTQYAATGEEKGQTGGSGSGKDVTGSDVAYDGYTWSPGRNGAYSSGDGGKRRGWGGFGGGAAVGADGGDGEDSVDGWNGDGGDGATPIQAKNSTKYGFGGNGGHGGGGAGGGGMMAETPDHGSDWYTPGRNGKPGPGGLGGLGGFGALLTYV